MAEKKKGFEQLNQEDLNNVKAGIPPYESPVIVDLSNSIMTDCLEGTSCISGTPTKCAKGTACNPGKI